MGQPIGVLITVSSYGTRLHGDPRGSVDEDHRQYSAPMLPPSTARQVFRAMQMKFAPLIFDAAMRRVIRQTIEEVCRHRQWNLLRVNVRTNHMHAVVVANADASRVLKDLKAWCTRRLREAGLVGDRPVWTDQGSTRKLFDGDDVGGAVDYVKNRQGPDLPEA
jgi:REP element-mobilizing transposase RayT